MTTADPAPLMPPRLPARPLTLDDVAELAAMDDAHRYELDEGTLVVMAPPDIDHGVIVTRLLVWLVANGHDVRQVIANPGVRIRGRSTGRVPDLMVLRRPLKGALWAEPRDVSLVLEVVSKGSEKLDRVIKPLEYARVRIPEYWRVERDGVEPTVQMYRLGADKRGEPAYVEHEVVLLDKLLEGEPPKL